MRKYNIGMKQDLNKSKEQISKLREQNKSLREQVRELKSKVNELKKENRELSTYSKSIEKLNSKLSKEVEMWKKKRRTVCVDSANKPMNVVKKIHDEHPELMQQFQYLCKEWEIPTRNFANTVNAIYRLLNPDENGVTSASVFDLTNYLAALHKLGKGIYMNHPSLGQYYAPTDSLILFKHYKAIRRIMLETYYPKQAKIEEQGCRFHQATILGRPITGKRSAVCSEQDVEQQQRDAVHPNDTLKIEDFIGDDLLFERERRVKKKTGSCDLAGIPERQRHMAERIFGKEEWLKEVEVKDEIR